MRTDNPPEQGQLVDVRHLRCVVTEVRKASLAGDPVLSGPISTQHLVSLSSVEDDGLGEELQVVWELEPGARVYEKVELPGPTGFDEPRLLDAFLDAVKWGAASTADTYTLQAPFRSGVDVEDYQLDPVVRAIQMPRVSLLVADAVGLGKTIESGLVIQELIFRHLVRKILVVCPSDLQVQWKDQMRDKFGLEFRIIDGDAMKELRRTRGIHTNPWTSFPRLITSIDFLKRERPLRLFRETLPGEGEPRYPRRYDLLIVDEAHNVAPSGTGRYATDSQRTEAVRALAPHFEHKLFLTATPHNGYSESFTALLELLDSQRFARGVQPDRNQLQAIMVRRLKHEIRDFDGRPRFPERKLRHIEVPYTADEREAHAKLREYTKLRTEGSRDDAERYATEFVLKLLKKRLFSSPVSFLSTLEKHEQSLAAARRGGGHRPLAKPTVGFLRRQLDQQMDESFADDAALQQTTFEAVGNATKLFRDVTAEEQGLIEWLKQWAARYGGRPDSKAEKLIDWLSGHVKPGGEWSDTRVIIFTEYRDTQNWLHTLFAARGLADGERLMTLYGGMDSHERERVKAAFQAGPEVSPVRILLATDAASEGINLQNHCSRLIHYEIPWNPNRMEQRNGRVDRYGQRAPEVEVFHFAPEGFREEQGLAGRKPGELEGDLEFLMRAAIKVNTIREDLGKVGPVIAQQVEEAMLGRRPRLDTERAERESEPVRRLLAFERKVREQIAKLQEQLNETRNRLRLTPENIESVVRIGLDLADQPPLLEAEVPGFGGKAFLMPAFKAPSWRDCADGLIHPHTGHVRPIVFDPDLARGRDDVVLVHLNHRLVQMCLRLLRAEVWSNEGKKRLHRVTARLVPNSTLDHPAMIAYGRIVVTGGDRHRLHEEVITAGGVIREGRFSRMNVGEVKGALSSALPDSAPNAIRERLADLWEKHRGPLINSLQAKMEERTKSLERTLQERADAEVGKITEVLEELRRSISKELAAPEHQMQLELFTTTEREQFERNVDALRARVEQIPREIEQETAAIRARFSDPVPRLFPLAVTYLVPQKYAQGRGF